MGGREFTFHPILYVSGLNDGKLLGDGVEMDITTVKDAEGNAVSLVKNEKISLADGSETTSTELVDMAYQQGVIAAKFITKQTSKFANSYKDFLESNKYNMIEDLLGSIAIGESLEDTSYIFLHRLQKNACM